METWSICITKRTKQGRLRTNMEGEVGVWFLALYATQGEQFLRYQHVLALLD